MSYLTKLPHDIYILIYKYVYKDCMTELIKSARDKRNTKYKDKFMKAIMNGDVRLYYTSLVMFNMESLGIIGKDENCDKYYANEMSDVAGETGELEELYYLSDITEYNFRKHHYDILITAELPENFKDATCIKMKLTNIDILLGFNEGFHNGDDENDDNIYIPLYYLLDDFLTTWLELIYYTNKLLNEYLAINNIVINVNFFPLYRFDTIVENGYKVIVPFFEEPIQ
jgi:hypothetical protein